MTQNSIAHTFPVSDVRPETAVLPTTPVQAALEHVLKTPVESSSGQKTLVVEPYGFHQLIEMVHRAFDEHYPIALRPDDIWLVIAQGFARCVNADPERYRGLFVSHQGDKEIRIRRDGFRLGDPTNDWQGVFPDFSAAIRKHIGSDTHGLLLADFSTTGPVEKAASEVVLMDTVQAYFRYVVETRCGIPSVMLEGSAEDWAAVARKTRSLAAFGGLDWWLNELYPVVDELAAAARGNPDRGFWQDIYKGQEQSGGIEADGWLLKLIPFVTNWRGETQKNPVITSGYGVSAANLPAALSNVPFIWDYFGQLHDYQFIAGHVGYTQDPATFALRPQMGWAVRPKPQQRQESGRRR